MKLTTELRRAINAVICKTNTDAQMTREKRQKLIKEWIERTPNVRKLVQAYEKANETKKSIASQMQSLGLSSYDFTEVSDARRLKAAGLVLPEVTPLNENTILARLACADAVSGAAILKEMGIIWE